MQAEEAVRLVSDGIQVEPLLVAPIVALPMLLFGKPLLERLQRIQIKYGMMEP